MQSGISHTLRLTLLLLATSGLIPLEASGNEAKSPDVTQSAAAPGYQRK